MMKEFIKEWLSYSRRERNGIFVLLVLLLLLLGAPSIMLWIEKREAVDFTAFREEIRLFRQAVRAREKKAEPEEGRKEPQERSGQRSKATLFEFDPNQLPEEKWRILGLPEKVIRTIKNYESKGGRFYKKEDLEKIYGLSREDYQRLAPYIRIEKNKKPDFKEQPKPQITIAVNEADSAQWLKLYGIGPYFAGAIVKYRELLGGYIDKQQLLEVYGMDSGRYARIAPRLSLQDTTVRKININKADYVELVKHPYISSPVANWIINYRGQHGDYQHTDALKASYLIDEALYQKLKPYLSIQ